jgi:hypothetical protein
VNYPNYQGAPAGYPAQPDPYQQPQGQPAYGAQPGYPQQPQPAQPGYGQQPPPPAPVLAGPPPTMSDFYEQPAGGGNSLSFEQAGTRYSGTILRTVTRADIEVATEMGDRTKVAKYQDGRVKLIMKVPILLDQPHPKYPTGEATWIVKAGDRNELLRAMEAAGAQPDPELGFMRPAAGDHITIVYTHDQPSRNGMNPKKVKRVEYTLGNGTAPALPQQNLQAVAGAASGFGQPQPGYQQPAPPQQSQPLPGQYSAPVPAASPNDAYGQYLQNGGQPGGIGPFQFEGQPPQPAPPMQGYLPQQYAQQPDPNLAYQQATGQQMQPGPHGQPQADWNPYAAQQFQQQNAQPSFPTPAGPVPGIYPSVTAQPSAAPLPSNPVPGGPPADWPADVPFQPGMTVAQARIAQAVKLGIAQQAPPA